MQNFHSVNNTNSNISDSDSLLTTNNINFSSYNKNNKFSNIESSASTSACSSATSSSIGSEQQNMSENWEDSDHHHHQIQQLNPGHSSVNNVGGQSQSRWGQKYVEHNENDSLSTGNLVNFNDKLNNDTSNTTDNMNNYNKDHAITITSDDHSQTQDYQQSDNTNIDKNSDCQSKSCCNKQPYKPGPPSLRFFKNRDIWCVFEPAGLICLFMTYSILFSSWYVMNFNLFFSYNTLPWIYPVPIRGLMFVIWNGLWGLGIWSHVTCMLTNPGAVPLAKNSESEALQLQDFCAASHAEILGDVISGKSFSLNRDLGQNQALSKERFCEKCDQKKPHRSHHCSVCKRCILRMDHHCPWVNNCVGKWNQKHFLLFLLYICLTSWSGIFCLVFRLYDCGKYDGFRWERYSYLTAKPLKPDEAYGYSQNPLSLNLNLPDFVGGEGGYQQGQQETSTGYENAEQYSDSDQYQEDSQSQSYDSNDDQQQNFESSNPTVESSAPKRRLSNQKHQPLTSFVQVIEKHSVPDSQYYTTTTKSNNKYNMNSKPLPGPSSFYQKSNPNLRMFHSNQHDHQIHQIQNQLDEATDPYLKTQLQTILLYLQSGYPEYAEHCNFTDVDFIMDACTIFFGIVFGLFTIAVFCDQIAAIMSDQTLIEKLQAKRQAKRQKEEQQQLQQQQFKESQRAENSESDVKERRALMSKGSENDNNNDSTSGENLNNNLNLISDDDVNKYHHEYHIRNSRNSYNSKDKRTDSHDRNQSCCIWLLRTVFCCNQLEVYMDLVQSWCKCCCSKKSESDSGGGASFTGPSAKAKRSKFIRALSEVCGSGRKLNWRWLVPLPVEKQYSKTII